MLWDIMVAASLVVAVLASLADREVVAALASVMGLILLFLGIATDFLIREDR